MAARAAGCRGSWPSSSPGTRSSSSSTSGRHGGRRALPLQDLDERRGGAGGIEVEVLPDFPRPDRRRDPPPARARPLYRHPLLRQDHAQPLRGRLGARRPHRLLRRPRLRAPQDGAVRAELRLAARQAAQGHPRNRLPPHADRPQRPGEQVFRPRGRRGERRDPGGHRPEQLVILLSLGPRLLQVQGLRLLRRRLRRDRRHLLRRRLDRALCLGPGRARP